MPAAISLCMIAKNEEANLPSCLGSVAGLVDEVIVVDTGSSDRTKEAASRLGARVFDFTWIDDFAAARNESIRHARGKWIFWLDGDEWLDADNQKRLRTLLGNLGEDNSGYVMKQRSVSEPASGEASLFAQVRLFRNDPRIRWQYRVHEQILPALEQLGCPIHFTDVVIEHAGYEEPALYRRKQERNLQLLQRQDAEHPNDPLTLFNLGLTYHCLGRATEAMQFWRRSLELASPTLSLVRKLYALMAKGQIQAGRRDEALAMCQSGLARYPDDVELLSMEAGLLSERGDLAGAEAALVRLLNAAPTPYFAASLDAGLGTYKARYNLGTIYQAQDRLADAEEQWRAALTERPTHVPALLELGNLYLVQGRWQELDAVAAQLEAIPQGVLGADQLRALKCFARLELPAARQHLNAAIDRHPGDLQLILLLSRVLLREARDWAAAESALRRVLEIDPYHIEARNNLTVLLRQLGRPADPMPSSLANELLQRAEKAFQATNYADAGALYRPLLHAGFQPGLMLYRLACIANSQGDYAGAWELHCQAVANDPGLAAKITAPESPHRNVVCRPQYEQEEVRACPVCGGAEQTAMMVVNCLTFNLYHPSIHPVRRWVRCQTCGHGFANPRPGPAALRQAYQDPPVAHALNWTYEWLTTCADIAHDLWQRRPGGSFLDVGVGKGALAAAAVDHGYQATGIDVHPVYADHVRRLGVEFLVGDAVSYDFQGRQYEIIALGDVIEHVADPRALIRKMVSLLKPDGLIWLSTPNFEGAWTRALRERDAMWQEGEHLQYFCLRSLTRLLSDHGLGIVDYRLSKRFVGSVEAIIKKA
jgi:tetratricopeptide (TPR) repeat protein/SAM-dependent methyltransferase